MLLVALGLGCVLDNKASLLKLAFNLDGVLLSQLSLLFVALGFDCIRQLCRSLKLAFDLGGILLREL